LLISYISVYIFQVYAIILCGSGPTFSAGADIGEFGTGRPTDTPVLLDV